MQTINQRAAGSTDPGLQRQVNEDRFHIDPVRGLFMVIDGIGGQAAGGKAADVALTMLRTRLERETGPVPERIREAIAIANNEIHRMASLRPEWEGMACVLTVAVIEDDRATIGHVGDTRLYKLRNDRVEKITHDHSPVGEREDASELSESEAMRHPRRNEVYRDVGSEPHEPGDPEFVEIQQVPFERDAALLLCSDGLSDLVTSASMVRIVHQHAGDSQKVARALVAAANDAGGKDNVTVVYVEGSHFASAARSTAGGGARGLGSIRAWRQTLVVAALVILVLAVGFVAGWTRGPRLFPAGPNAGRVARLVGMADADSTALDPQIVKPSESIMAAIARARPGSDVIVEPGEYREQLMLRDGVRVLSRVPRAATLRLPSEASESDAAVVATGLSKAEISGFRIIGDAATPLGTGILVQDAALAMIDVEIAGATRVAVDFSGGGDAALIGSEIRDNPGAAIATRAGSAPRIAQNFFARNGSSERAAQAFIVEPGAHPQWYRNLFHGIGPESLTGLDDATRRAVTHDNWFLGAERQGSPPAPRRRQGR